MKQCVWCEKTMKKQNFNKHQKACFYKIEIELKKCDLVRMKQNPLPPDPDDDEMKKKELEYSELKIFLQDFYRKSFQLNRKIAEEETRDPTERIQELKVSDVTKEHYLREWSL